MRKYIFFVLVSIILTSCKSDAKSEKSEIEGNISGEIVTLKGDFIYYADAAVLQTSNEIYGVVIDEKMEELNDLVKPYKKESTDMVSVTVKASKFEKPKDEEGWQYRLKIKEIIKVEQTSSDKQDVIKIGE